MKVGLVLSGGMAKGAYELGALKAVSEYLTPDKIQYISSASIGAAIAYAFSSDKLDDAFAMWRDINKDYQKLFLRTVLSSDYFSSVIKTVACNNLCAEKFYISLLKLKGFQNCYINLSDCGREIRQSYLAASVALTPFTKPVLINGSYFVDGGFVDNIPVYPLLRYELDYVICIHFDKDDYQFETPDFDRRVIKIVFNDESEILKKTLWFTRSETEQMFESGYTKAKHILDFVFSNGTENVAAVTEKTAFLNSLRPKKQIRFTCDIIANNITRCARKFAKTEIYK